MRYRCYLILVICLCRPVTLPAASMEILQAARLFDESVIDLNQRLFQADTDVTPDHTEIEHFAASLRPLLQQPDEVAAIRLVHRHIPLLLDNLDDPVILQIIPLLLDHNIYTLANRLLTAIEDEADPAVVATARFHFAKYHADRNQWSEVQPLLENTASELADDDYAYGQLLKGVALQHLRHHRKALNDFRNVAPDSAYYAAAQINIAIANLKQGWWSDSNETVNKLLASASDAELVNKLHLYIGYSMLKQEFYQDAREAFRKVGLDSRYTNRALLGIAITAASYGDYAGGINALNVLKSRKPVDLSADEAYVFLPFIYEKLHQDRNIIQAHNDAIRYYQQRIHHLQRLRDRDDILSKVKYDPQSGNIQLAETLMEYDRDYPPSIEKNRRILQDLLTRDLAGEDRDSILANLSEAERLYRSIIETHLDERIEQLTYYLNQSRYGLAYFYDKKNKQAVKGDE